MAQNSEIAWTDSTFNPWMGCSKVSPGCAHCYAENLMDTRYGKVEWGPSGTRVKTSDAYWRKPLAWNKAAIAEAVRPRVFCASLADVFEDWQGPILDSKGRGLFKRHNAGGSYLLRYNLPLSPQDEYQLGDSALTMGDLRRDLFALIDATPHLDWLLLTKRPENIWRMWEPTEALPLPDRTVDLRERPHPQFRPNVWIGTSVENQEMADERIQHLLKCRDLAPVLWLSVEPMLGPVNLRQTHRLTERNEQPLMRPIDGVDWVVFGGESDQGSPARPCNVEWIRDGLRQCHEASVPAFIKQLGSRPYSEDAKSFRDWPDRTGYFMDGEGIHFDLSDKAGADPSEWPEDLRIREFPESIQIARNQ